MSPESNKPSSPEGPQATTPSCDPPTRIITGPLLASNLIAKDEGGPVSELGTKWGVFFLECWHPGAGFLASCPLPRVTFVLFPEHFWFSLLPELDRIVAPNPLWLETYNLIVLTDTVWTEVTHVTFRLKHLTTERSSVDLSSFWYCLVYWLLH